MAEFQRVVVTSGQTSSVNGGTITNPKVYTSNGAAAEVQSGGVLNVTGAEFITNSAYQDKEPYCSGGAIYVSGGTLNTSNANFSRNFAPFGSILYNANGTVNISGGVFFSNYAGTKGGIINCSGTVNVSGATFTGNTGGLNGVSLYNSGGSVKITDTKFSDNKAPSNGAGVYNVGGTATDGTVEVSGCTFTNNKCGAIYNAATATVSGATFTGNITTFKGGAILNSKGTLNVTDGIFTSNGTSSGGAIFNTNSATVSGATFTGNTATFGGAIYNTFYLSSGVNLGSILDISGGVFTGNTATSNGGAIFNGSSGCIVNVSSAAFSGNTATTFGGAIFNDGGTVNLSGATFLNNRAFTSGGAIYNNSGTINCAGLVDLQTNTDDWYNAASSTVNWDISGGLEQYGSITHFERYTNANNTVKQTITVSATQEAGEYVLATGNLSDAATDATGKYTFKATTDGNTFSGAITVGASDPVIFEDNRYSLAVDYGKQDDLTDDKLVLTVEATFGVSVDKALKDKWFKAGETVTLTGSYVSEETPSITVGDEEATVDSGSKTWSYTYNPTPADTKGTDVTIAITDGVQSADTTYKLKVDTVAPEITSVTLNGEEYTGEWMSVDPKTAVVTIKLDDATSGIDASILKIAYDGSPWDEGSEYTYTTETGVITFNQGVIPKGSHMLTINVSDNAGNALTGASRNVFVKLDVTAPKIENAKFSGYGYYDSATNRYWFKQDAEGTVTAKITDSDSGVDTTDFNGIAGVKGENDIYTFTLDTSSEAKVNGKKIVATDKAGNSNGSAAYNYGVDGTGPVIGDISVDSANIYEVTVGTAYWVKQNVAATAKVTITDDKSGVKSATFEGKDYASGNDAAIDTTAETELLDRTFAAVDNVGNESSKSVKVGVDGTGPTIGTATVSGKNVYRNWIKTGTAFAVTTEIADAKSGLESASLEGADYADGKFELIAGTQETGLADHTINATDNVGNGNTAKVKYGFDGTGPTIGEITADSYSGETKFVDGAGTVYFRQDDETASVAVKIDDKKSGLKSAVLFDTEAYQDGGFKLKTELEGGTVGAISAVDNVGNDVKKTKAVSYTVDGTGPEIGEITAESYSGETKFVDDAGMVYFKQNDETASVAVDIGDEVSGLKSAVLFGTEAYQEGGFKLKTELEGGIFGAIRAVDNVGNAVKKTKAVYYTVDGTGPTISVVKTPESLSPTVTVEAAFSDGEGSGVKEALYSLNGGESWTAYEKALSVTQNQTVLFKATDNVGNVSEVTTYVTNAVAITITANSATKTYDGTSLADSGYTFNEDALIAGDVLTATVEGSLTDAGTAANRVTSYKVMRGDVDVTASYTFADTVDGVLTVNRRTVTLTSADGRKEYDGEALTAKTVTVGGDGFAKGEGAAYDVTGSQTEVGSSNNFFTYELDEGTKAGNYDVTTVFGTLVVTPAAAQETEPEYNPSTGSATVVVTEDETNDTYVQNVRGATAVVVRNESEQTLSVGKVVSNGGEATVANAGAGDMDVASVTGKVSATVVNSGTGELTVETVVAPTVEIDNNATMEIKAATASGDVTILNDGHLEANVATDAGHVKLVNSSKDTFTGTLAGKAIAVTEAKTEGRIVDATLTAETISFEDAQTLENVVLNGAVSVAKDAALTLNGTLTGGEATKLANDGTLNWDLTDGETTELAYSLMGGNAGKLAVSVKAMDQATGSYTLVTGYTGTDMDAWTLADTDGRTFALTVGGEAVKTGERAYVLAKEAATNDLVFGVVETVAPVLSAKTTSEIAFDTSSKTVSLLTSTATVELTATDALSDIAAYRVNGGEWIETPGATKTWSQTFDVALAPAEARKIYEVRDAAGNVGTLDFAAGSDTLEIDLGDFKSRTLKFDKGDAIAFGFKTMTGTEKNDTVSFGAGSTVRLFGGTADFGAGTNTVKVEKNADVAFLGEKFANVTTVNVAAGSTVRLTVTAAGKRASTTYQAVTAADFASLDFSDGKSAKLSAGKYTAVTAGDIVADEEKSGKISVGTNATFAAGDVTGVKTVSVSSGAKHSYDAFDLESFAKKEQGVTTFAAGDVKTTEKGDTLSFGNFNDVTLGSVSTLDGNDKLSLGNDATASVVSVAFGADNDTLTVGQRSAFVTDLVDFGTDTDKLTVGRDATALIGKLVFADDGKDSRGNPVKPNDTIKVDQGATAVIKSAEGLDSVKSFTLAKGSTLYGTEEVLGAVTKQDKTATVREIDDADLAFDGLMSELQSTLEGGQVDLVDLTLVGDKATKTIGLTDLEGAEIADAKLVGFDADGRRLADWNGGSLDGVNSVAVELAEGLDKVQQYKLSIAVA